MQHLLDEDMLQLEKLQSLLIKGLSITGPTNSVTGAHPISLHLLSSVNLLYLTYVYNNTHMTDITD